MRLDCLAKGFDTFFVRKPANKKHSPRTVPLYTLNPVRPECRARAVYRGMI